jgi:hypothetical protein
MGLTVKNLPAVKLNFARSEEKVARGSLAGLRAAAETVAKLAQDYAPVDTGDLEGAIKAEPVRERTALGRFGATSFEVGVDVAELNLEEHGGYDYSIQMHEDPNYKLGPASAAKQSSSGKQVGYKFLERALKDSEAKIQRSMEAAVTRSLK